MSKLDSWIDNKVIQNAFIWFVLFLILAATIQADDSILVSFYIILLLAPTVYINNLYILPFLRKKFLVFISLFLLNTTVFTIISVFIIKSSLGQTLELSMFVNFFGILLLALAFASAMKIARDSFVLRQQEKEAELKLLKAQLNPHFLFNTLNNLYGLSVVKSDKLPNLMLKLSDLLRYSLYETKETYVPLEKELSYLKNYMDLEKIRLEDKTEIVFENRVSDSTIKIAPMLLIVFVENAFKHLDIDHERSQVYVAVSAKDGQLIFKSHNTFNTNAKQNDHSLEKGRSGIGLQNVKKRLALMYPNKHQLSILETGGRYEVELILDL